MGDPFKPVLMTGLGKGHPTGYIVLAQALSAVLQIGALQLTYLGPNRRGGVEAGHSI